MSLLLVALPMISVLIVLLAGPLQSFQTDGPEEYTWRDGDRLRTVSLVPPADLDRLLATREEAPPPVSGETPNRPAEDARDVDLTRAVGASRF